MVCAHGRECVLNSCLRVHVSRVHIRVLACVCVYPMGLFVCRLCCSSSPCRLL